MLRFTNGQSEARDDDVSAGLGRYADSDPPQNPQGWKAGLEMWISTYASSLQGEVKPRVFVITKIRKSQRAAFDSPVQRYECYFR